MNKWLHLLSSVGFKIQKCLFNKFTWVYSTHSVNISILYIDVSTVHEVWRPLGRNYLFIPFFVDNSYVVGASPVGAAPTTSSFSAKHLASLDWAKTTARRDEKHLSSGILGALY